ncbi:MAG: inositol monophosphatase family protein [Acidimicrobiales bacterium]
MAPEDLIGLFDDLAARLGDRLEDQIGWDLTGTVPGQYEHDVVADELIVPALLDVGLRVLTEESGISGSGDITVVVDPIDGSTNAARGLPWFATSLCAVDADGPLASGVYNLALGDRFVAVRGEGSEYLPSECTELGEAIVALSGYPDRHLGWRQYRAYGAAALDMCAVGTGSFDAFIDTDAAHGVWDYLGALLFCAEAGCAVGELNDDELVVLETEARRGPIVAATRELLADIKSALNHS